MPDSGSAIGRAARKARLLPATTAGFAEVEGRASPEFARLFATYQRIKASYVDPVEDEHRLPAASDDDAARARRKRDRLRGGIGQHGRHALLPRERRAGVVGLHRDRLHDEFAARWAADFGGRAGRAAKWSLTLIWAFLAVGPGPPVHLPPW